MQLLMRRPEIDGFISIAPPANMYDFTFLAPCPASGLMVTGSQDEIVPPESVTKLVESCASSAASRSVTRSSRAPTISSRTSWTSWTGS